MAQADDMDFPPPDLGAAILKTIADVTGRKIARSSVYAFLGECIEVAVVLEEDGGLAVRVSDPTAGDA